MPEIGEVARVVHYLRQHLVGKRITNTFVQEDDIVYGKVGTSASAYKKAMDGKRILDAGQQGKYFYLVCDKPPHPVMHLGMTGWIRFSDMDDASSYRADKEKAEDKVWPPRFWKFRFQTGETEGRNEIAFVDARRLARIRLVDAPGEDLRKHSPLKENGPDPVVDKEILTVEWLEQKMRSKRVPVKALLLDQANISGVGNWVADEVLYQARIHPEQYSNTFSDEQIKTLHDSLISVCTIAVDTLADQSKFPDEWIMKYRWDKGKQDANVLPNGERITHLKVGGRTSAVVLSRQKKTGDVSGAAKTAEAEAGAEQSAQEEDGSGTESKPKKRARKRKSDNNDIKNEEQDEEEPEAKKLARSTPKKQKGHDSPQAKSGAAEPKAVPKKANGTKATKVKKTEATAEAETTGRRRSARLSKG